MTLAEYCYESVKQGQLAASENRMLPVAAQLLDVSVATTASGPVALGTLMSVRLSYSRHQNPCCCLQTLQALHGRACVAHLDLTSNNVMLRHDAVGPWDNVRLIDFGLSRSCQAGTP